MSTRAQIKVIQEGMPRDEAPAAFSLYHHWDGYPSNILPLIKQAYTLGRGEKRNKAFAKVGLKSKPFFEEWRNGRAGKVASFLCAVEPGAFEPMQGHKVGEWVEWYYVIHAMNHNRGSVEDSPTWNVEIYEPSKNSMSLKQTIFDFGNKSNIKIGAYAEKLMEIINND